MKNCYIALLTSTEHTFVEGNTALSFRAAVRKTLKKDRGHYLPLPEIGPYTAMMTETPEKPYSLNPILTALKGYPVYGRALVARDEGETLSLLTLDETEELKAAIRKTTKRALDALARKYGYEDVDDWEHKPF